MLILAANRQYFWFLLLWLFFAGSKWFVSFIKFSIVKKESCLSNNRKSQELLPVFGSSTIFALHIGIQIKPSLPEIMERPHSGGSHHEAEYAEQ